MLQSNINKHFGMVNSLRHKRQEIKLESKTGSKPQTALPAFAEVFGCSNP